MMFGLDGNLDVVANDAGAAAAGRHRAGIGIGQRDLLVRRGKHVRLENREPPHLLLQLLDLLFEAARLGLERLGRLLPVGSVELLQIARHALLDLRHPPLHLRPREVPVAVVHRLELAAVDRHAGLRQQAHRAAQRNKARAHLADGTAIVLAEVGNRLVIGHQPARKPHHLDVVPSLTLKPPARLNPVEIAVNIELQQHRRMIRRPAGCLGSRPRQTQARPGRVPRQKHRSPEPDCPRRSSLPGIPETACSARDPCPQRSASSDPSANRAGIIPRESNEQCVFTQAGSIIATRSSRRDGFFPPKAAATFVAPPRQLRANFDQSAAQQTEGPPRAATPHVLLTLKRGLSILADRRSATRPHGRFGLAPVRRVMRPG